MKETYGACAVSVRKANEESRKEQEMNLNSGFTRVAERLMENNRAEMANKRL